MKKLIICFVFIGLAILFIPGCINVNRTVEQEPAAKIVIYTSMYEGAIESVRRDLQRQFPRVEVEFVYSGTGVLQQRVASERSSGRLGADILMVADPAFSLELKEAGMLHPFRYREARNLAFEYDPDGYWYPVRVSNMVLAFNPLRNSRHTVPNSFYEFANDTWVAGTISMRNPLVSGTTMATISALRDLYGNEYLETLGRQRVIIDYGSEETLTKLETGVCRVAMILEESILKARRGGSRLEIIYPTDGTIVIPSSIMIINDRWSANRNALAAEAIADWFLSANGQDAIVDGWMHSVRSDFPRIPHGSVPMEEILANSITVNWENIFRQRSDIQARFEEYILARR